MLLDTKGSTLCNNSYEKCADWANIEEKRHISRFQGLEEVGSSMASLRNGKRVLELDGDNSYTAL